MIYTKFSKRLHTRGSKLSGEILINKIRLTEYSKGGYSVFLVSLAILRYNMWDISKGWPKTMKQIMLKNGKEDKYFRGYPLVDKDDIFEMPSMDEGELVALVDAGKNFIATAYYGEQNKGIGWVLSLDSTEK